jgi:hypothetical protein
MPDPKDVLGSYYAGMSDQELEAIIAKRFAPHIVAAAVRELERRGIVPLSRIRVASPRPRPKMPAGAGIHLAVLEIVRSYRHWRRHLFHGQPPEWFTELTGMAGYVNFFQLLPTLSAIAFVPDRFARRIPSLADRKHHLYLGPIKYISTWASLILALLAVAGISGLNRLLVLLLVLAVSLSSPAWITAYLVFVQFWIFFANRFENCKENVLPIVFRRSTYAALSGRLLFWPLTYFGGYLSVGVMVCGGLIYVAFHVVIFFFGSDRGALQLNGVVIALVAVWSARILVMPQWIAVLRSGVRRPTQEMIRMDLRPIAEIAYAFLERVAAGDKRTEDLRSELVYQWPLVRRDLLQQELQGARGGSLPELLHDRSGLGVDPTLGDVFQLMSELLQTCDRTLKIERIDADLLKLCAGLSLREKISVTNSGSAPDELPRTTGSGQS